MRARACMHACVIYGGSEMPRGGEIGVSPLRHSLRGDQVEWVVWFGEDKLTLTSIIIALIAIDQDFSAGKAPF